MIKQLIKRSVVTPLLVGTFATVLVVDLIEGDDREDTATLIEDATNTVLRYVFTGKLDGFR